jgi:hypothetical protein
LTEEQNKASSGYYPKNNSSIFDLEDKIRKMSDDINVLRDKVVSYKSKEDQNKKNVSGKLVRI